MSSTPERPRLTFFIDVDNTLIDNDDAKHELARQLETLLGDAGASRFWEIYEAVRDEFGLVDLPRTIGRYLDGSSDRALLFALSDLVMEFPYDDFLYPDALAVLHHLRSLGRVAILSDGDPVFQAAKIARSGLSLAAGGYVLVYPHKEEHIPEITIAFAADHYVLIDDKPTVLQRFSERMSQPLTTVFVRQGHYAAAVPDGRRAGAGLTIDRIGALLSLSADDFVLAGGGGA